jgi:FlaG/FlaF family flagellin (archaellin)
MDSSTIIWIIVAVIVVLAIAALVAAALRKKQAEQRRREAEQLRQEAVGNVDTIRQTHVGAKEAEVRAERARLEAEQAEAEAAAAQRAVDVERATYEDRLREADRLDPDVDHKATETRSYDEPITGQTTGQATGSTTDQVAYDRTTRDRTI